MPLQVTAASAYAQVWNAHAGMNLALLDKMEMVFLRRDVLSYTDFYAKD